MIHIFTDGLESGLLYALLALGVFISFRILNFADLSAEGTITLGAVIMAVLIKNETNLLLATILVVIAGFLFGSLTGFLNTKLKIPTILAGIIVMTALYSINLIILGSANLSIMRLNNIFSQMSNLISNPFLARTITLIIVVAITTAILYFFFGTEVGLTIRATGMNKEMAKAQGINTDVMIILGLGISNALIALGGSLIAQSNGSANLNMGRGTIVIGLASIIIGEAVCGKKTFKVWITSIIVGSILYQTLFSIVIYFNINTNILQLLQAILITLILGIPLIKKMILSKESLAYDKIN